MIAQMVGAGQLIKLLFGMDYLYAEILVGAIMMIYVLFGGMTATTWVQIIKACMLLGGATFMALRGAVPVRLLARGDVRRPSSQDRPGEGCTPRQARPVDHGPGRARSRTRSRRSRFGMALMFGTAGLPHILMRFFTVPNAKEARKSVAGPPPGSATSTS